LSKIEWPILPRGSSGRPGRSSSNSAPRVSSPVGWHTQHRRVPNSPALTPVEDVARHTVGPPATWFFSWTSEPFILQVPEALEDCHAPGHPRPGSPGDHPTPPTGTHAPIHRRGISRLHRDDSQALASRPRPGTRRIAAGLPPLRPNPAAERRPSDPRRLLAEAPPSYLGRRLHRPATPAEVARPPAAPGADPATLVPSGRRQSHARAASPSGPPPGDDAP